MDIKEPLNEQEKLECTVRWLNALYRHWAFGSYHDTDKLYSRGPSGPYSIREARCHENNFPCDVCPLWEEKCRHNTMSLRELTPPCVENPVGPDGQTIFPVPIQLYFQVLEKFAGPGTVVNASGH